MLGDLHGEDKAMLLIKITLEKTEYNLGEPLPIAVVYSNRGSTSIKKEDPLKSLNIEMHVIDKKTSEDMNYTMGKIEVTHLGGNTDEYVIVEPIPDYVEIEAGGELSFVTDVNNRLYLRPGKFECELRDGAIISNRRNFAVQYTVKSVDLLFNIVKDPTLGYSRREWATYWLEELAPDFRFKLTLDTESEEVKKQNEYANEKIYDAFSNWWKGNKDSKEVAIKLERINQMTPQ
jgi:hypothetical protein